MPDKVRNLVAAYNLPHFLWTVACSRLSVSEDDRKREPSGRRAGSAASGIRSSPARFFSPPLTESLEQAMWTEKKKQT